jgi:pyridoxal phosphate enzyme (YggS family)
MSARADEIARSLKEVEERILASAQSAGRPRGEITLIAVTKTYPASDVQILRSLGVENFGENRNEEGEEKSAVVDGIWHFQGQIQSKKLSAISKWAHYIHSLDDPIHLEKLERSLDLQKFTGKKGIFLQLTLDAAEGRGGVKADALEALGEIVLASPHLTLMGLMCVPPVDAHPEEAFAQVAQVHQSFKQIFPQASALSIGMSGDFEIAISYGATHIRVGSSILGPRTYPK